MQQQCEKKHHHTQNKIFLGLLAFVVSSIFPPLVIAGGSRNYSNTYTTFLECGRQIFHLSPSRQVGNLGWGGFDNPEDQFEFFAGIGQDRSISGESANEWYWAKTRAWGCRVPEEDRIVQLGLFAYLNDGNGYSSATNDYDWRQWSIGPSLKILKPFDYDGFQNGTKWEFGLDFGIVGQKKVANKNTSEAGIYRSWVDADTFYFSSYVIAYDEAEELSQVWLPKWEWSMEYIHPSRTHQNAIWNSSRVPFDHISDQRLLETVIRPDLFWENIGTITLAFRPEIGFGRDFTSETNYTLLGIGLRFLHEQESLHGEISGEISLGSLTVISWKKELEGDRDAFQWLKLDIDMGRLLNLFFDED